MSTDLSKDEVNKLEDGTPKSELQETEEQPKEETVEMAQSEEPQTSGATFGTWFTTFVQTAKDKSADTFQSIKRDLNEFKEAVQSDTSSMVYSTASVVKTAFTEIGHTVNEIGSLGTSTEGQETPKEDPAVVEEPIEEGERKSSFNLETLNSFTNILTDKAKSTFTIVKDTLVESIVGNRDYLVDELDDELFVNRNGEIIPIENWKAMLAKLQTDPDTYCREPNGPPEEFESWLESFNLLNYHKQTEFMLETVPEMRKLHDELVPRAMSSDDFWHRYYYKLHRMREEQKRLILDVDDTTPSTSSAVSPVHPKSKESSVDVKYLNETKKTDKTTKLSRSNTEDWEKMDGGSSLASDVDRKSKDTDRSSSDDGEWIKCD